MLSNGLWMAHRSKDVEYSGAWMNERERERVLVVVMSLRLG